MKKGSGRGLAGARSAPTLGKERVRRKEEGDNVEVGARERNIFPGGTRITVETRKIMKLALKSVKVNII